MENQSNQVNEAEPGFIDILKNLTQTFIQFITDLTGLASLEARLAGKSLVNLVLLTFILGAFFLSAWLGFLALLAIFFVSVLHCSWILSLFFVFMVNFFMIILVSLMMAKLKENLLFRATRKQLGLLKNKEPIHEQPATEN